MSNTEDWIALLSRGCLVARLRYLCLPTLCCNPCPLASVVVAREMSCAVLLCDPYLIDCLINVTVGMSPSRLILSCVGDNL